MVPPRSARTSRRTKTEPDKNTYLVLKNELRRDPNYDYGTHFLFQGHEGRVRSPARRQKGYITRINLDADARTASRCWRRTTTDGERRSPIIDGSTWDPGRKRLLFTTENGTQATYWQATLGFPSHGARHLRRARPRPATRASRTTPRATSGSSRTAAARPDAVNSHARQPEQLRLPVRAEEPRESPRRRQAAGAAGDVAPDPRPADRRSTQVRPTPTSSRTTRRTCTRTGTCFHTKWVTIHDTAVDGIDALRRERAREGGERRRPSSGPRTACSGPARSSRRSSSTRPATRTHSPRPALLYGGFGGVFRS